MATNSDTPAAGPRPAGPLGAGPCDPPAVAGIIAPMIGRDRELQLLLHDLYDVIEGGEARLVTVVGAAGIGKSRLAYELRQVVGRLPDSVGVLGLQADSQSAGQPYSLVRQLVAGLFHIREGDSPRAVRARLEQGVAALLGPGSVEQAHLIGQLANEYTLTESRSALGKVVTFRFATSLVGADNAFTFSVLGGLDHLYPRALATALWKVFEPAHL